MVVGGNLFSVSAACARCCGKPRPVRGAYLVSLPPALAQMMSFPALDCKEGTRGEAGSACSLSQKPADSAAPQRGPFRTFPELAALLGTAPTQKTEPHHVLQLLGEKVERTGNTWQFDASGCGSSYLSLCLQPSVPPIWVTDLRFLIVKLTTAWYDVTRGPWTTHRSAAVQNVKRTQG